jgi:hypothetical protein
MAPRSIRMIGTYLDRGKIQLEDGKIVAWQELSSEEPPVVPYGTRAEIAITFEAADYLSGTEGIVWATYDSEQAELLRSTLQVQNISCEVREQELTERALYLIYVSDPQDAETAMDFIWRDDSGLRLQPDWQYPAGAENESIKKWTNDK